ncbi:MAG: sensor histidine kinase [Desulfobacteraceae bacterium]|nr:MAG: sensor histidine kinase [Desulfobacteraceae bacterium]
MKNILFPIFLKKMLPLIYVAALALTVLIAYVGYSTSRQAQEIITSQFNQQQLILARKISDHIQNQISHLQKSLLAIRETWQVNQKISAQTSAEILRQYQQLLSGDVLSLMVLNGQGHPVWRLQDPSWAPKEIPLPDLKALEPFLPNPLSPNRIWIGRTFSLAGKWVLPLMVPLTDPKNRETGVQGAVVFILDAVQIAKKATFGVVSGSTGYAWVINSQGILFDHFENEFVGRSIFEVRKARNPQLSYKIIDDLTRRELLQRKEGTARYLSGWHRSKLTKTEKLIAYTPIPFFETPERQGRPQPLPAEEFWSVALVAPIEEVSGLIRSLDIRQFLLVGIFQLLIIFGTGLLVFISSRWSAALTIEVDRKTEELKRSQEKLIHSERLAAVGSMASHVSHEIKNPLIAIGGLAQQLKRAANLGDREKEKLDLITREVSRLENMLIEVRDFTRPTTPRKIKGAINPLIQEVLALMKPVFTDQKIEIQADLNPRLPEFEFDPEQVKQVLLNLIKNAAEAMTAGGRLGVKTYSLASSVFIEISDSGKGISPEHLGNLFRPFFTTKKKGTGLGLAVSYKIVQDHNGDIQVASEVNQGTRMVVQLPL